nr:Na/Pi cotransporter family protein [uncultured Desulfobacter sp.]
MPKKNIFFICVCLLMLCPFPAYASQKASVNLMMLLTGLFGGLALFLFGLEQLSTGLKTIAGNTLKTLLSKLTSNRITGAFTGAIVTGVLNSSSVTTVLVVGFVTAGAMSLEQSVGVIMGANIGSTITGQMLAFNISQYSLIPVAVGFFMLFVSKREHFQSYGAMIMGLGLVFYGMAVMSDAMYPLRDYPPFLNLLENLEHPAMGILAGAAFAGLVQSSSATVGIAIAMAAGGILTLHTGISLALGANIGTCITALMASLGKPAEAVRAAVVHVAFNILGVVIWLPFISSLASIATAASPLSPELEGAARMAAEVPRQIANANTIFNILNTILFLPFTAVFAKLASKVVKDSPTPAPVIEPLYLDRSFLEVPKLAFDGVRKELARAAGIIIDMMQRFEESFKQGDYEDIDRLADEDDKIDILEKESLEYLAKIRAGTLSEEESVEHQCLMLSAITLENLADIILIDFVELVRRSREQGHNPSEKTRELLAGIYNNVSQSVALIVPLIHDKDLDAATRILDLKPEIARLQKAFINRKSERLGLNTTNAMKNIQIEMSLADKFQRIFIFTQKIAKEHLLNSSV